MKSFLVSKRERMEILKKHASLIKEQVANNKPSEEELLKAALQSCFTTGDAKIRRFISTGQPFIERPSTSKPGQVVRYFADLTYYFFDPATKQKGATAKYKCDAITNFGKPTPSDALVQQWKDKGWATKDELISQKKDITNLEFDYDKKQINNVTLYKLKGEVVGGLESGSELGKSWIEWMDENEFEVNPTETEKTKLKPIPIEQTGYRGKDFPKGQVVWFDPTKKRDIAKKNPLAKIQKATDVERNLCRRNVESFYNEFKLNFGTPEEEIPNKVDIRKQKEVVQRCVNKFYGKWGPLGGGKKLDGFIDVLTGNSSERGPVRNSMFRLVRRS